MEGFGGVLVMSLVMLLGSYIAGSIPLFFSLSEEKLQLVSVMGAGLLVGTALSVIIPEGMQTLNMAYRWLGLHQSMKAFLFTKPFPASKSMRAIMMVKALKNQDMLISTRRTLCLTSLVSAWFLALFSCSLWIRCQFQPSDNLPMIYSRKKDNDVQVANAMSASRDVEVGKGRGVVSWTATLGLVVHAAADGVALGAAATTNQTDVEVSLATLSYPPFYPTTIFRLLSSWR